MGSCLCKDGINTRPDAEFTNLESRQSRRSRMVCENPDRLEIMLTEELAILDQPIIDALVLETLRVIR